MTGRGASWMGRHPGRIDRSVGRSSLVAAAWRRNNVVASSAVAAPYRLNFHRQLPIVDSSRTTHPVAATTLQPARHWHTAAVFAWNPRGKAFSTDCIPRVSGRLVTLRLVHPCHGKDTPTHIVSTEAQHQRSGTSYRTSFPDGQSFPHDSETAGTRGGRLSKKCRGSRGTPHYR